MVNAIDALNHGVVIIVKGIFTWSVVTGTVVGYKEYN